MKKSKLEMDIEKIEKRIYEIENKIRDLNDEIKKLSIRFTDHIYGPEHTHK